MKHVQTIDEAVDCDYPIHRCSDEDFDRLFPDSGQDVGFSEDVRERLGERGYHEIMNRLNGSRIDKKTVHGIHGLLFVGLPFKKEFYPNKRDSDLDELHRPRTERNEENRE